MNSMQVFRCSDKELRTVEVRGERWWVLEDVCDALGVEASRNLWRRIPSRDKTVINIKPCTPGGKAYLSLINEPAVYEVVFRSEKPQAVEFRRWITHEVLPSIRKSGFYAGDRFSDANLTLFLQTLNDMLETRQRGLMTM